MSRYSNKSIARLAPLLSFIIILSISCASQQTKLLEEKQDDVLKTYKQQVSVTIKDPIRARGLITLAEDLHQHIKHHTTILQQLFDKLNSLNQKYDTQRVDLEVVLQNINQQRTEMLEYILTARVKATKLTTPQEWQKLMNRRKNMIDFIKETPGFI
jgi:ribosomal protein S15P/S13E